MKKETNPSTEVVNATKPAGFQPGHVKVGGRKRRWGGAARALMEEMGTTADPIRFMLSLVQEGVVTQAEIVNGKRQKVQVTVPLEVRLDAAKTVAGYVYPRLSAQQTQISGPDGGPIAHATLDVTKILADPDRARIAQELALMVVEQDTGGNELPADHPMRYLPPA